MTQTLMTLAMWDALPEDGERRRELVGGVVVVVPMPQVRHQRAAARLWAALDRALPRPLLATLETGVVLSTSPPTVRAPDVAVLAAPDDLGRHRWDPHEVLLVVEVLSPGHRSTDLVTKRGEYAAAGIAEYWIVDLDAPSLAQLRLGDASYDVVGVHTGPTTLETCGEQVTLDLDTLGT